jgi:hypothetical protein
MEMNRTVLIRVALAVIVIGLGLWYYVHTRAPKPAPPAVVAQPAPAQEEAAIAHPIPQGAGDASKGALPDLASSDPAVSSAAAALAGDAAVKSYLTPDNIIRRLVVTVDNLPRQKIAVDRRPINPPPGSFIADGDELHSTLDARNFARYQPMVEVIRKLDMQQLAATYVRFYPLFQNVYQNLGYPNGYFNDRLVQVIDVLLATPQISGPIDLVRPNVMYTYADPTLEARPAGQKLLIRMGPENAAVIKAKLVELRAAVTAAAPKR